MRVPIHTMLEKCVIVCFFFSRSVYEEQVSPLADKLTYVLGVMAAPNFQRLQLLPSASESVRDCICFRQ